MTASNICLILQLKSIRMLGMVHLVAVHTRHLPYVRDIRPGYCKTALLGLLVNNELQLF